jgi:hypothetical protein
VAVRVEAGEGGENASRSVRDENGVVVRVQRAVVPDEVQEVRHLLQVGGNLRVVTAEMGVVELDVDHPLDVVKGRS